MCGDYIVTRPARLFGGWTGAGGLRAAPRPERPTQAAPLFHDITLQLSQLNTHLFSNFCSKLLEIFFRIQNCISVTADSSVR